MKTKLLTALLLFTWIVTIGQNTSPFPSSGPVGIGTTSPLFNTMLHVYEGGSSLSTWRGRIVSSGQNSAVVMGEWNGKACLAAHIPSLTGWADLVIQHGGGNVGIGTLSPQIKLDIQGAGAANTDLRVNGRIQTGDGSNLGGIWVSTTSSMFMGQVNANSLGLYNGGWRLIAHSNGNVGIGTNNPTQTLTVNGTIYGKEVLVDLNVQGPDYVFEKDYTLPSLEEVKVYIEKNKHLPEVPSAKEMEANGINVGEMNMILLKKMEEMTLYMIEQQQTNTQLQERIKSLEEQLNKK